MELYHGDCLEVMKTLPSHSVDCIFTDLPYGTTHNEWDKLIPMADMWEAYKRILKIGGVILLFAQMRLAVNLIASSGGWFRYEWVWHKPLPLGFLDAKRRPLRDHEFLLVFSEKGYPKYHPQMVQGITRKSITRSLTESYNTNPGFHEVISVSDKRYPRDTVSFGTSGTTKSHPTEKPVEILEYFIRTYTDEGDTVLDSCMGSGSTGVAALHLNRNFIGIEKEEKYFKIAKHRCANVPVGEKSLFD